MDSIKDIINDLLLFIRNTYLDELDKYVSQNSQLKDIQIDIEYSNDMYRLTFVVADYWKYFEYGRGPGGMPPVDEIEKWINVKRLIPKSYNGKIPTTRQMAFMISRSIGKNGTEGHFVLDKVLRSTELDSKMRDIKNEVVTTIINEIIEDYNDKIKKLQ